MTYALIAGMAVLIVMLLGALVVGQPASAAADRQQVQAQSTQIASLYATVYARPTATPQRRQF